MKNKAVSGIMLTLLILCVLSINITGIAVAAPEHDVAVKQISAPSKVALGSIVPINVEIANEGGFPEIVHVTVYYDSNYLDSQDVTLPVAELKTVSFSWDTTGMAQGVYVLNATVTIPEDGDPTDNWKTAILIVRAPTVVATVDVVPNTLSLKSKGKWITAYIQLPERYDAEDIDATTILLNGTIPPVLDPKYDFVTNSSEYLVDHNEDGILERMVKFDKAEVMALLSAGEATLTITGEVDGTPFEGSDSIRVMCPSHRVRRI